MTSRYTGHLSFNLMVNTGEGFEQRHIEAREKVYREFPGWGPMNGPILLNSLNSARLLERITTLSSHPVARIRFAMLELTLDEQSASKAEWFVVCPEFGDCEDPRQDKLVEVRTDRLDGSVGWLQAYATIIVSERWRRIVEANRLTGLEFLWCIDKGRYAAEQWFIAHSRSFLGRGVSHPWFDESKRRRNREDRAHHQATEEQWIAGVREFHLDQAIESRLADSTEWPTFLRSMRTCVDPSKFRIRTPRRVLRSHLPKTDFAYRRCGLPDLGGEHLGYTYELCCTAQVRELLLMSGLVRKGHFEPVEVHEHAPADAIAFDQIYPNPSPPYFTEEEFLHSARLERKAQSRLAKNPKPQQPLKPIPLDTVMRRLKQRLKASDAPIAKGATSPDLAEIQRELGLPLPAVWSAVLATINGFTIEACCAIDGVDDLHIEPTATLVSAHQAMIEQLNAYEPDITPSLIGAGTTGTGDMILLDAGNATPNGDCPVIQCSHETGERLRTWKSISHFLAEAAMPRE